MNDKEKKEITMGGFCIGDVIVITGAGITGIVIAKYITQNECLYEVRWMANGEANTHMFYDFELKLKAE